MSPLGGCCRRLAARLPWQPIGQGLELLAELVGLLLRHRLDEFHDLDLDAGPGDTGVGDAVEGLAADADFEFGALPPPGRKDIADVRRLLGLGLGDQSKEAGEDHRDKEAGSVHGLGSLQRR